MTSPAALSTRMRKIEARRPPGVAVYVVWGASLEDAAQQIAERQKDGTLRAGDEFVGVAWPDPPPLPRSRQIVFRDGIGHEPDITDRELEVLVDAFEAEARNREVALT